jgi:hypothetical protein
MPFRNEHAARIKTPLSGDNVITRRKNIAPGIDIVIQRRPGGKAMIVQAYRFDVKRFTIAQAKKWLRDHNVKFILFEKAVPEK